MASSTELSTTSQTRWCKPISPVEPMYIAGRRRTASRPPRTLIDFASYLWPPCGVPTTFSLSPIISPGAASAHVCSRRGTDSGQFGSARPRSKLVTHGLLAQSQILRSLVPGGRVDLEEDLKRIDNPGIVLDSRLFLKYLKRERIPANCLFP